MQRRAFLGSVVSAVAFGQHQSHTASAGVNPSYAQPLESDPADLELSGREDLNLRRSGPEAEYLLHTRCAA